MQYVALFRGINVGGKNILPMKELREILADIGCEDVQTYIQSGNVVLRSKMGVSRLAAAIANRIDKRFGFAPKILLLPAERFIELAAGNPYAVLDTEAKFVHVAFLTAKAAVPDLDALESNRAASEEFELANGAFYLHAPDGIGRSKLAANLDRYLGVDTTARNLRTVNKLIELLGA